jgi:hypothetical protein
LSDEQKDKIIYYMSCIEQLAPYFSDYKSVRFIKAFKFFLDKKNFNFPEFLKKVQTHRDKFYPVSNATEYKKMIQYLYNYARKGNKITFIQA